MSKNGVYPAFPSERAGNGLSKRELFAAMAMQGMIASPDHRSTVEELSKWAVVYADNLLNALETK